ncbi:hypothetical protein [Sphingomonas arenae]|uniref:hypothetical protein n=1 Tax=Sphingomonas arenae TaxID=2812555 RepID=UPI00196882B7|nr:hypothetical protein [Sphingomonas arenae]
MEGPGSTAAARGQARVDAIQAAVRAGAARPSIRRSDPPPLDPALVQTDDPFALRVAEELEYVRRLVEQLGDTLASDGLVVTRYGMTLQSVDLASQILGHLATLIRSSAPELAARRIGMTELKARLLRGPL